MSKNLICGILVLFGVVFNVKTFAYDLKLKSTGSAVLGAQINFTAELYENGKIAPKSKTNTFTWTDNANPQNTQTISTDESYSNFSVIYSKTKYTPGRYEMKVSVDRTFVFPYNIGRKSIDYHVTELLAGNLSLVQNGTERNDYVSVNSSVNHTIQLREADYLYLMENATYITTYWFRNCGYVAETDGLTYNAVYDKENEEYEIEALVVASFEKIPEPTTTTTTTTTTPATTTTSTTVKPTTSSTTIPTSTEHASTTTTPSSTVSPTQPTRLRRDVANDTSATNKTDKKPTPVEKEVSPSGEEIDVKDIKQINSTSNKSKTDPIPNNDSFHNQPFICLNTSVVAPDPNKTYGYFHRKVVAKIPVSNLSITGNSWLQHGEILNLKAKCTGSLPLNYCIKLFLGPYNVTGNETCASWISLDSCEIAFKHFFQQTTTQTVVIIVSNPVHKVVNQFAVNFYEATKQSQLSVIVVPVSFTFVAVILVVFGAAYYIQNKNRFIIEVADFNFGDSQSVDMEYKTFRERLIDSIREIMPRRNLNSSSMETTSGAGSSGGGGGGGDDSSIKYGSMT